MEEKYSKFFIENKILRKSKQRFKSDRHSISTIKVNKIALCPNDKKRMHTFDCRKAFLCGTSKELRDTNRKIHK